MAYVSVYLHTYPPTRTLAVPLLQMTEVVHKDRQTYC